MLELRVLRVECSEVSMFRGGLSYFGSGLSYAGHSLCAGSLNLPPNIYIYRYTYRYTYIYMPNIHL